MSGCFALIDKMLMQHYFLNEKHIHKALIIFGGNCQDSHHAWLNFKTVEQPCMTFQLLMWEEEKTILIVFSRRIFLNSIFILTFNRLSHGAVQEGCIKLERINVKCLNSAMGDLFVKKLSISRRKCVWNLLTFPIKKNMCFNNLLVR